MLSLLQKDVGPISTYCLIRFTKDGIQWLFKVMGRVQKCYWRSHDQFHSFDRVTGLCSCIHVGRVHSSDGGHGLKEGLRAHALNRKTDSSQVEAATEYFLAHTLQYFLACTPQPTRQLIVQQLESSIVASLWVAIVILVLQKAMEFFCLFYDQVTSLLRL